MTLQQIFEGGGAGKGAGGLCKVTLAEGFPQFPDDQFYVPLPRSRHRAERCS